ncbi:putative L-PSP endoribonuclease family protein [Aspergillus similis]
MEPVYSSDAVSPIGPYSQAMKAHGFIFASGQIPATTKGELITGTIAEKTHKTCQNAASVLAAAGSSLDKVVKVNVYFESLDDFKEFNEVYAEYFPHKPARSSSQAQALPAGASLMLDIIALQ